MTVRYSISKETLDKVQAVIEQHLFDYSEDGESYNNEDAWAAKSALDSEYIQTNCQGDDNERETM